MESISAIGHKRLCADLGIFKFDRLLDGNATDVESVRLF